MISVPIHAVDLLCDPQDIAYSHSVLPFSPERLLILPDFTVILKASLNLGTENQRTHVSTVHLTRSDLLSCSRWWRGLS